MEQESDHAVANPGERPGGTAPLFLDQTEDRKQLFGDRSLPPFFCKGLDDRAPPLSHGLDPSLSWVARLRAVSLSLVIGSLSNSVVERRTSTGSGPFASLGSGLFETLG